MGLKSSISAVVVTLNEGPRLRSTVESLRATLPRGSEIIVVDDGSVDGSSGFLRRASRLATLIRIRNAGSPRARNIGAARATGEIVLFCDAHMEFAGDWSKSLAATLDDHRVGAAAPAIADLEDPENAGYGMTIPEPDLTARWLSRSAAAPYAAPVLPGACWAMRRELFLGTGGFDEGLLHWGSEDVEYSIRLWLLGYELMVVPGTRVAHFFRDSGDDRPYEVKWSSVQHNKLRLAQVHFNARRQAKVVEALRAEKGFKTAWRLVRKGATALRARQLVEQRRRDDDWFCARFAIEW